MPAKPYARSAGIDRESAEPFEVGTVQWVRRPGEGDREQLAAGYWFVSPAEAPAPMVVTAHADETVHIVEGHVTIDVGGGPVLELRAGSSASLNRGTLATWTVRAPTVEFFVYS